MLIVSERGCSCNLHGRPTHALSLAKKVNTLACQLLTNAIDIPRTLQSLNARHITRLGLVTCHGGNAVGSNARHQVVRPEKIKYREKAAVVRTAILVVKLYGVFCGSESERGRERTAFVSSKPGRISTSLPISLHHEYFILFSDWNWRSRVCFHSACSTVQCHGARVQFYSVIAFLLMADIVALAKCVSSSLSRTKQLTAPWGRLWRLFSDNLPDLVHEPDLPGKGLLLYSEEVQVPSHIFQSACFCNVARTLHLGAAMQYCTYS